MSIVVTSQTGHTANNAFRDATRDTLFISRINNCDLTTVKTICLFILWCYLNKLVITVINAYLFCYVFNNSVNSISRHFMTLLRDVVLETRYHYIDNKVNQQTSNKCDVLEGISLNQVALNGVYTVFNLFMFCSFCTVLK